MERDRNFIIKDNPFMPSDRSNYNRFQNSVKASFLCWLKDFTCEVCEFRNPTRSFHFHHVDPKKKKLNILGGLGKKNKVKLIKEVLKCVYVCENCHYKIHAQEGGLNGNYEIINRRRHSYISNLLGGTKRGKVGR